MERLVGEMLVGGSGSASPSGLGFGAEKRGASAAEGEGEPASADEFFAFLQQYTAMGGSLDPDQAPPELGPVLKSLAEGAGGVGALKQMLAGGGGEDLGGTSAFERMVGSMGDPSSAGAPGAPSAPLDREEIVPEPGFVVKTVDDTGRKVFINVCGHFKIQAPGSEWANGVVPTAVENALANLDDPDAVQHLRFPLSVSDARNELDKKGSPCTVYDAVFNADVVKQAIVSRRLKVFLVELVLQWIAQKYETPLDPQYKLPHRRYVGDAEKPTPQFIRVDRKSMIEELQEPDEEPSFPLRPRRSERQVREEAAAKKQTAEAKAKSAKTTTTTTKFAGRDAKSGSLEAASGSHVSSSSVASESAAFAFDGLPEVKHEVSFKGRPVTSVVVTIDVPFGIDPENVKVCAVTEGVTVDMPGRKQARVAFPFAVDGDAATCAFDENPVRRQVTFEAPYVPYDQLVRKHAAPVVREGALAKLSAGFLDV
jgi:hypothetical protein